MLSTIALNKILFILINEYYLLPIIEEIYEFIKITIDHTGTPFKYFLKWFFIAFGTFIAFDLLNFRSYT